MKNEFDNKLTDKGWSRMNRLLDREMPERRRRFVWWPWLALLLLGSGAGSWWIYRQPVSAQPAPEPAARPKPAEPVVTAPAAPAQVIRQGNTAQPATASPTGTNTERNTPSSLSAKGPAGYRIESAPAITLLQAADKQRTESEKAISGTATNSPESLSGGIAGEKAPELPVGSSAAIAIGQKILALTALPQANALPGAKTPAPVLFSADAPLTTPDIKPAPRLKRWSFGAGAGITSGDFSAINGFSVGALTEFRLSRRWGLRSGLQFAQYNLPADERPVVSVNAQDYNKATGNDVQDNSIGTPSSDPSQTPVFVPLERTKRLEIPMLAYWQPVGGLRVLGGLSAGYLLSTRASEMNYANNQLYLANNQDALSNLNALTARSTSRWNLDWQLGLGWRFGKHLELNTFYKRQFNMNLGTTTADQFNPGSFGTSALGESIGSNSYTTPSFQLHGIWFF